MIILTSERPGIVCTAQVRSSLDSGLKPLYKATSTSGEEEAARAVVRKYWHEAAADTVRQVKDASEIASLVGDFFKDPKRKQVFNVWVFDRTAKPAPKPAPKPKPKPTKNKAPSTKNAPLALLLPPSLEAIDQGDPAFTDLRRHYGTFRACVSVTLGAVVAMGAEIARLRAAAKPAEGRPRKTGNSVASFHATPWRELVKVHAGVDHETARRAEKVAGDLRLRLDGKRDKASVAARRLLDSPGSIRRYEDYAVLAEVVGHAYDADTWHGILVEAGIVRRPVQAGGGGDEREPPRRLTLAEEAVVTATAFLASLRESRAHREQWRKRLAALDADPTGDPDRPSLHEILLELKDTTTEVEEILHRKKSAA